MTTHLVLGASGQVGAELLRAIAHSGARPVGTFCHHPAPGLRHADIRSAEQVNALLQELRPAVVYLPGAETNVEFCELHPDETYQTNVLGVCNVARAVRPIGAKIVYFSSDYVFDGHHGPYREDDPANPLSHYGRQKLLAEHALATSGQDYLILRTTVVYGRDRQEKNFICRLLQHLRDGRPIQVPVDQVGSPTYGPNLADAALELAASDAAGVYHVVGPRRANRYQFACAAATVFGADPALIQAVPTSQLGQTAPRPLNSGMLADKASARLKSVRLIDYEEGLQIMAAEMKKEFDDGSPRTAAEDPGAGP